MYSKNYRPSWWLLYLIISIVISSFLILMRSSLSDGERRLIEILIILIAYSAISLWLKANQGTIIQEDLENWRAAVRNEPSQIAPQSVKAVPTPRNSNYQPQRMWGSIHNRLADRVAALTPFFHIFLK